MRMRDTENGECGEEANSGFSSSSGYGYASIEKQRQRLPIYKYRAAIVYLVEIHATTIIVSESGHSKITQNWIMGAP
ncbi:ATPdependent RNA helicase [Stylosanthes scabra]|uniref:ATPdependent RNA helicase n=1 Tax=Stylosanthes scabra TaxID=79078 RepID=A0ABU6WI66_9FABA|nr:ATPdependent RNA helicase [Stylosanthes scabra]